MYRWPLLLLIIVAVHATNLQADPQTTLVMLQGKSTPELVSLVRRNGGAVTHQLPIINAVGASLNREQLEQVLQSPLVSRHIDDLSVPAEDPPEGEQPGACHLGGALELSSSGNTIHWEIYDQGEKATSLQRIDLTWPPRMGKLKRASFNDYDVSSAAINSQQNSSFNVDFPRDKQPTLHPRNRLSLKFEHGLEAPIPSAQHLFSIALRFANDCATSLIPGYPENGSDTYYPSVVGAAQLHRLGVTGAGVTVAVLDSGLWQHKYLTKNTHKEHRLLTTYNAITDTLGDAVFDESGHGTHITSVIANSQAVSRVGQKDSYKGIAPDANIIAIKAFNEAGQGDMLDIVRGIQWVVQHRQNYNIRVLNLSFAAKPRWPYWLDPINQAVKTAWQSGITVVAAAGNEGPDAMTVGSPGNTPYIITVGAVTDSWTTNTTDDDYIPDFSSRGPTPSAHIKPDIVAPGGHIAGLTRPNSTLTKEHPYYLISSGEFVMTGTSQAAALVSGIAALLLQLDPALSPDDVKCKLMSSAEPAINLDGRLAYSPFQQGNGYVSATRAVTLGKKGCANRNLNLEKDLAGEEHYQGSATVSEDGDPSLPGLEKALAPGEAAKGLSHDRRWGVKAHIERKLSQDQKELFNSEDHFDWEAQYHQEKTRILELSAPSVDD